MTYGLVTMFRKGEQILTQQDEHSTTSGNVRGGVKQKKGTEGFGFGPTT